MGSDLFDLSGKKALVTGGAQGMGRMIAEGFLAAGATVYITSRKAATAEQAAREMAADGRCIPLAGGLDSAEAIVRLAEALKARETMLNVLVNNAGKTWGAPLESFPDEAWPSVMAVNVQGPFTLVRELLPLLRAAAAERQPARVINIGSVAGKQVEPIAAYSYAASKAGVAHLSRVLAAELAGDGVTVNTIVPGYFPTKMTAHIRAEEEKERALAGRIPLGRLGSADDIAGACIYLASPAGGYVTGSELVLDGGLSGCH